MLQPSPRSSMETPLMPNLHQHSQINGCSIVPMNDGLNHCIVASPEPATGAGRDFACIRPHLMSFVELSIAIDELTDSMPSRNAAFWCIALMCTLSSATLRSTAASSLVLGHSCKHQNESDWSLFSCLNPSHH